MSTITLLCSILLASHDIFAQKIMIGYTRQQLQKEIPRYRSKFESQQRTVPIENFDLHGMKGFATFSFDNNRLILFQWIYPNEGVKHGGLSEQEVALYGVLLRSLQKDWGTGILRSSVYYPNTQDCDWQTPMSTGNMSISPLSIKVTMNDLAFLKKMMRH